LEPNEEKNQKVIEIAPPPISKELKKRWSYFIEKVYQADPLISSKCKGETRIISCFDQPEVIIHAKRNSSLIEAWGSKTEQTQAQGGSKPI
jgi:hypothetical protein